MRKLLLTLPLLASPLLAACSAPVSHSAALYVRPPVGTELREACAMGLRDPEICQQEDETRHRAKKAALHAATSPAGRRLAEEGHRLYPRDIPRPEWSVDEDKLARDRAEARVRAAAWRADGGVAGAEARPSLYTPPISSPLYWPSGYALARGRTMGRR